MSTAQNLRDLMSLAGKLRQFAEATLDTNHDLFISTAEALESRAHYLALVQDCCEADLAHDAALHAPVNQLV